MTMVADYSDKQARPHPEVLPLQTNAGKMAFAIREPAQKVSSDSVDSIRHCAADRFLSFQHPQAK